VRRTVKILVKGERIAVHMRSSGNGQERRPHPEQGFRSCLGILRLARPFGVARLEAAARSPPRSTASKPIDRLRSDERMLAAANVLLDADVTTFRH
jgi:transposase